MLLKDFSIIDKTSSFYPKKLLPLKDSPDILFVKGDLNLLNSFSISIVGTRHCNVNESEIARKISKDLSKMRYHYNKRICSRNRFNSSQCIN